MLHGLSPSDGITAFSTSKYMLQNTILLNFKYEGISILKFVPENNVGVNLKGRTCFKIPLDRTCVGFENKCVMPGCLFSWCQTPMILVCYK